MAEPRRQRTWWRSPAGIACLGLLGLGVLLLLIDHGAHVFGALPFVLILACPLVHLFMHGGHRRQGASKPGGANDP